MQASSGAQDSTFIVAHLDALRRHGKLKEGYRVEFTYRSKKHKGILELSDEGNKELCIKSLASGELYDNPGGWLEAEAARTLSEQKPGEYKSRFNAWKKITVTDEEGKNLGTLFSLRHVSGPVAASPKRPLKRRSKAEPATVAEGHGQSEKRKENVNQNDKNRQTDQAQHIVEHQGRKMKQVNQTDVELITMSVVTQNSYRKTRRGPVVEKNDSFDQALQQFAQIEDREAEEDYTIAVEPDEEIEGISYQTYPFDFLIVQPRRAMVLGRACRVEALWVSSTRQRLVFAGEEGQVAGHARCHQVHQSPKEAIQQIKSQTRARCVGVWLYFLSCNPNADI